MQQEVKEFEETNPVMKFLDAVSRIFNLLFRVGERIPITTPSPPKELSAKFPKKLSREQERMRIWRKNQLRFRINQKTS
jgi:hypothetical protein